MVVMAVVKRSSDANNGVPQPRKRRKTGDGEGDPELHPDFDEEGLSVGIIERIVLKNFMCHGHLDFSFGPNVNFVVGSNGSGKSAVLTALVVGLGGKATITGRGTSMKNFVKNQKSYAEIMIRLSNKGTDGYKRDLYGDSLTVVRRINQDGQTSYKLKSDKGVVISTKKEELTHILDQFNIQVDNPVSILNQDTSRNFLQSKLPTDKYKFFLKATQLQQMTNDYSTIQEQKDIMEETLLRKEEDLEGLEKDVLEKEQKFKDLTALGTLNEKKEQLIKMSAWAQVAVIEREIEPINRNMKKEDNRTPKFDQKIEESNMKQSHVAEEYQDINNSLEELLQNANHLKPDVDVAKRECDKEKARLKESQKNLKEIRSSLRTLRDEKKELEDEISNLKNSAHQDYEEERLLREASINEKKNEKESFEKNLNDKEHELQQFTSAVKRDRAKMGQIKQQQEEFSRQLHDQNTQLNRLKSSQANRLKIYGDFTPRLLEEIAKATRNKLFHRQPKGPIGSLISLVEDKWALAIECCLKSLVYAYICHDYHDEKTLKQIMKRVIPHSFKPVVIVSSFEDKKYSDLTQVRSEFPCLLDQISVEDPDVFNCLIDQRGIEFVILVEEGRQARDYMFRSPPQNCKECFTLEGDQIYPGKNQRSYASTQTKAQVLKASLDDEVGETLNDIEMTKQNVSRIQEEVKQVSNSMRQNQTQERNLLVHRKKIQDKISQLTLEINELLATEEPANVDVSTLEGEVEKYQIEIMGLSVLYWLLQDELKKKYTELETAKQHCTHYNNKKKEHLKVLADLQKELEAKQKEIESAQEKARSICAERIETRRTAQNIDSEINQISKRIEKERKSRGDPEQITREYYDAKNKFIEITTQMKNFKAFVTKLEELLKMRRHTYLEFRRFIAMRAKCYFAMMLSQRGYSGKMSFQHNENQLHIAALEACLRDRENAYFRFRKVIGVAVRIKFVQLISKRGFEGKLTMNHKDRVLSIQVHPHQGEGSASKDMKGLSGGERSFSTVCFIMALWESMESPFRALDEFDVFMDMVNRKISMDLMLKVAKEQKMRQFIFLTPLDMSKIKANPLVRISRLNDPERNQNALPFQPEEDE
ncbi:structural maintenance of chromosomes protein 6-like [Anneissia japonica]|uniref:structural maintenance of chromosomes protein 6-like n=1 Tax=Anneissia japonica TaxID=1529436 RepID=UPI001425AC3E|nr:structural maintenance of chromosomes protein 6-like [Anneissia japonica]